MTDRVDAGWSARELSTIELGDKRLERRAQRVTEELSSQPEAYINQASQDSAAAKAAYRFFDNEKVSAEKILSPHRERTLERIRGETVVLAIQDTTKLNYNSHENTVGLGPIGDSRKDTQGLHMHSCLAVTTEGLPLGFLSQRIWARSGYEAHSKLLHKRKPIEAKESYRWIEMLRETQKSAPPRTRLVTLCDRESDIYEFFVEAEKLGASFIVRGEWDRRVCHEQYSNLLEVLAAQPLAGQTTVTLPNRSITETSTLELDVRFAEVSVKAPRSRKSAGKLPPVTINAVQVVQTNAPHGEDAVEWLLLTNLPVTTREEALEKVAWYTRRWSIEVFHRILKSGCTVERCQLETAERLIKYLALMTVVAWRIFWITHFNRTNPKAPASVVLTKTELKALPLLFKRKPPYPHDRIPTVSQVVITIARLGGFMARRGDGHPGTTTIWRGWSRLADVATAVSNLNYF